MENIDNIDGDTLDQIGQMMGQDKKSIDQVKQVLKNPEAMKQMSKLLNNKLTKSAHPTIKSEKSRRNDSCPCKSGKKYKKCCLDNIIKN